MDLVDFPERNIVFAKDQPQYRPLPAYAVPRDNEGTIICCWELSWRELFTLVFTRRIWHSVLTFGHPLQPQLLQVHKPGMSHLAPVAATATAKMVKVETSGACHSEAPAVLRRRAGHSSSRWPRGDC